MNITSCRSALSSFLLRLSGNCSIPFPVNRSKKRSGIDGDDDLGFVLADDWLSNLAVETEQYLRLGASHT